MRALFFENKKWLLTLALVIAVSAITIMAGLSLSKVKSHDFAGKCQLCHTSIPKPGASLQDANLIDNVESMCSDCHKLNRKTSHPTGMRPSKPIPLERFLSVNGNMTCITCHAVHKEEDPSFSQMELAGLLRGHAQGRAFCATCHDERLLGSSWRHDMAITYAHMSGELRQKTGGALLDKFSVECLSCHDGTISKAASVDVTEGNFTHGIGLSHPVGVKYPTGFSDKEFVSSESLPEEVRLFNGTVGCLSCHNPYGREKSFLVKSNSRSALCLTCHKK